MVFALCAVYVIGLLLSIASNINYRMQGKKRRAFFVPLAFMFTTSFLLLEIIT